MRFEGFIGGAYQSQSLKADAQDCLNLYLETVESGNGKVPKALFGTPGIKRFTTLPEYPIRCMVPGEGRMFAIAGASLYEIFADQTYNRRGNVGNDGNPAFIAFNGNQIGIASAGNFYCDNGSGPVQPTYTESGLPVKAVQVVYWDGYFVAQQAYDSKQFFLSAILDGTTWSDLEFASKEAYPDNLTAILADHEELYLWGDEESSEVWQDTGALNFPMQRDPGAIMHFGCVAPFSPVRLGQGVAWLGIDQKRGAIIAIYAKGFQPQRISTHAVEQAWATYSTVSDAIAYSEIHNGHEFWVIVFPAANAAWAFDLTEGLWHRRGWWNGTSNDRPRVAFHAYVGLAAHGSSTGLPKQHFGGDWQNGNIYTISMAYTSDDGAAIQRQRTAPHLALPDRLNNLYPQEFWLDSQVQDSSMTLAYATGFTTAGALVFGPAKTPSSTNTDANNNTARTIWRRGGHYRTITAQVTSLSSTIPQQWTGAYLQMLKGTM